ARIVHTGREALTVAPAFAPHVVFLDIGLPDVSGYDVARRLRDMPALKDALLVALTGWGTQEDRQRTREAGFDRHLTKPAELSAVEELLRAAAKAQAGP
ncbi:MAG TPA: response regulator, partial [Ramlibacter sp.]|nr:response regulator [Ramlibacter sp.]